MKLTWLPTLLFFSSSISAASIPQSQEISVRDVALEPAYLDPRDFSTLEKRKGGGGGKGGGGSSGGKGGGTGSSGGGRSPSSYSFSPTQNTGGRTISGSGPRPAYAGGRYTGGATVPYTAGGRTPTRGYLPLALPVAAFAFFPGLWLYGALYAYPYHSYYYWNDGGRNRTANVTCLCQRYGECGCDDDGNSTFLETLIGNGTGRPVNSSTVRYISWPNGTQAAYVNGSLPNGTTAAGGTDPSDESQISGAVRALAVYGGYWVMAATVGAMVLVL